MTQVDLTIDQGTTFTTTLTVDSDITNNVVNIAAYSFSSQMRKSYYSANASETLVCTKTDVANGIFTISLPASNTANLLPYKYVYDVKMVDANNVISRLIEGVITVTPNVTR